MNVRGRKERPLFIAVEGPIGVGKTTLAKELADQLESYLLKEIVEENPFLDKFYQNREEWSFQTEMFFLCNRFKQLEEIQDEQLSLKHSVVADYHIFKNLIFAERNLKPEHFDKYKQIYQVLTKDIPKPDLVIYLRAGLETLLERIERRGRVFEQNMDPEYLYELSKAYDAFIEEFRMKHQDVMVLTFNGDELDFVNRPEDLKFILGSIFKALHMERNYA